MADQQSRRKKFVDPQVQGALVRRLIVHWIGFSVVAALLTFCLEWMRDPLTPLGVTAERALVNYGPLLVATILLTPIFIYDSIKLSNRFAGPIVRMRKAIRELAAGERPSPLKVRKQDHWQELVGEFNQVIDRVASTSSSSTAS